MASANPFDARPDDAIAHANAVVKMKFRRIAAEEYALMLARITPLDRAL
ncbi:hypothetical protein [Burkholderia stagnalis]